MDLLKSILDLLMKLFSKKQAENIVAQPSVIVQPEVVTQPQPEVVKAHVIDKQKIIDQLKIDEGVRLVVYRDSVGLPTVGVGHLVLQADNLKVGETITQEQCDSFLATDLEIAITSCHKLLPNFDSFPEEIQEVLVNMMFNLGINRLSKFVKFLAAINNADYTEAAVQMKDSDWYKQVGVRAGRLIAVVESVDDGTAIV